MKHLPIAQQCLREALEIAPQGSRMAQLITQALAIIAQNPKSDTDV